MIRVLIVDDHALMREFLKQLFDDDANIVVSAEARSGEGTLDIVRSGIALDLILLDISIPGCHGVELITKLKALPNCPPILILSMHNEVQIVKRKLKAGASGYITKDSMPNELLDAIRRVAAGGRYIAADMAEKIAFEASSSAPLLLHELLSSRELLILRMLASGKKVSEVAAELSISAKTVSTHKTRLMQKMHIDNDAKLVQYAINHGLVI